VASGAAAADLLYEVNCQRKNGCRMITALQRFALACLPMMCAFSIFATNSPAPADTNFVDPTITDDNSATKQLTEVLKKNGIKMDDVLDEHFMFASVIWGAVAGGYLLYARKQREIPPLIGGVAMMAASFMITSWFWMSLLCIGLMFGVYYQMKRGG
jgi:hypothetical protein